MATKAYVLIETAVGSTRDVFAELKGLDWIMSADMVTGPYDIIAVVEAPDLGSVGDMVTGLVHSIGGIQRPSHVWPSAPSRTTEEMAM